VPQAPVAPACRPPLAEPDWRTCRTAYERFAFAWPGKPWRSRASPG